MARRTDNQYAPDHVSPPGDTLQETLDALGNSQLDLAKRMGRSPKNVNQIVKGTAPILPGMAIDLETTLGVPAGFWLAREQNYRESLARKELERGWIRRAAQGVPQLRELLRFFGIHNPAQFREADLFARDLLIPPADYRRFRNEGRFDEASIRRFAQVLRISPGIVIGRLQHDGVIS